MIKIVDEDNELFKPKKKFLKSITEEELRDLIERRGEIDVETKLELIPSLIFYLNKADEKNDWLIEQKKYLLKVFSKDYGVSLTSRELELLTKDPEQFDESEFNLLKSYYPSHKLNNIAINFRNFCKEDNLHKVSNRLLFQILSVFLDYFYDKYLEEHESKKIEIADDEDVV